VTC
jgi:hypothetical protein